MSALVSVIIPVYNVERYLGRCLESAIHQTYPDIEIICVNDGSTDSSLSIADDYAEKDKRIAVISQKNGGPSSARNTGLKHCNGDYILFLDGDDALEADCVSSCIDAFADDIDVVCFSFNKIDSRGNKEAVLQKLEGKHAFHDGMLFRQYWEPWGKMYRRQELISHGMSFLEGRFYEDLEFNARYFCAAHPNVFYLTKRLYNYFYNEDSIMANTKKKKEGLAMDHILNLESIYDYLFMYDAVNKNMNDFLMLCEYSFQKAIKYSPHYEHARCFYEMTRLLRKFALNYEDYPLLSMIAEARYSVVFDKDVDLSKRRGLERVLCIKNEFNRKVLRLFGKRMMSW